MTEATSETAAPPTISSHASPGDRSPESGTQALQFVTLAPMSEGSTGAAQQNQPRRTESPRQGTVEEITENSEPGEPSATPPPTRHPGLGPPKLGTSAGDLHTGEFNSASGAIPPPGTLAAQDREVVPPQPRIPAQSRGMGGLDPGDLRGAYNVYHSTPRHTLVDALLGHIQGLRPDRSFAPAPLRRGAVNIFLRKLQAPLISQERTRNDLLVRPIWWFNLHQPDKGRVWVSHLAWSHTLIAPRTRPRPAPSPRGQERAPSQLTADALNIPPHNGLSAWESWTARDRGSNLPEIVERYTAGPETQAGPPGRVTPSIVSMVVLDNGQ